MASVTIYSKPGCHLCDVAVDVIEKIRRDTEFTVDRIDIRHDPDLMSLYGERIPVIHVNGRPAFQFRVDEGRLRQLLKEEISE